VVLAPPPALGTRDGLQRLREIDPAAEIDYQHLYVRGGEASPSHAPSPLQTSAQGALRIGLVDGGIDRTHPAFRTASLQTWGCDGVAVPSEHGTAVASLLVGRDAAFAGVMAAHTDLYAADVYCGRATGGNVEALAQALAWLVHERVAVINVSLVGPPNRLLERAVRAAAQRGHLIVAAVGNDGPASPPLYPAAYPEVVGVTGLSPSRRVLPEALRGPQVLFAAPGAEVAVAQSGATGYAVARGTSFAAPLVAGLLAEQLRVPDSVAAGVAVERLSRQASDLGARGRDDVFGWGLVAEQARNRPERVQALARPRP
jgi:subtilisin family serine protease